MRDETKGEPTSKVDSEDFQCEAERTAGTVCTLCVGFAGKRSVGLPFPPLRHDEKRLAAAA